MMSSQTRPVDGRRSNKKALITNAKAAPDIKLIASDVDGTLLDSKQRLSPKVEKAVKLSRSVGVPVWFSAPILPPLGHLVLACLLQILKLEETVQTAKWRSKPVLTLLILACMASDSALL